MKMTCKRENENQTMSNVINGLPIFMCRTINHSQVNATDRRLASSAANRMKFDNINGIPLFSALIHSVPFFFSLVHRKLVSLRLSNYHQNLLAHLSRQKRQRGQ